MSLASEYIFDPIKNGLARVLSSPTASSPQKAAATAALTAYNQTATDAAAAAPAVVAAVTSGQSPAAAVSPVIADLETGLANVVGAFAGAATAAYIPVVGAELSPEAAAGAKALLAFGEQEAHNLLAGLFASHNAAVDAAVVPQH